MFRFASLRPLLPEMRLQVFTPDAGGNLGALLLSPDGSNLLYQEFEGGKPPSRLALRPMSSTVSQPLPGTERADYPFWSADGQKIAFFRDKVLSWVSVAGGPVQTITTALDGRGGTWNREGTIVFAPGQNGTLHKVSASGGDSVEITHMAAGQTSHRFPVFLPDDRHFLFFAQGAPDVKGVYLGQLDVQDSHRLFDADSFAVFHDGYLLFVLQNRLMARKFDLGRLVVTGDPFIVERNFASDPTRNAADLTAGGPVIVYRAGKVGQIQQLSWFDRGGKRLTSPGQFSHFFADSPSFSPDGHRLAFEDYGKEGTFAIWMLDLDRGTTTRFTSDPILSYAPLWSPDEAHLAYAAIPGMTSLMMRPVKESGGADDVLLSSTTTKVPLDWSPDGQYLLFRTSNEASGYDVSALRLADRKVVEILHSRFNEVAATFSPDGHWLAYQSDESGRYEVYVESFPEPTDKFPVSLDGGGLPRWRKDGKELFYLDLGGNLRFVSVDKTGQKIKTSPSHPLFQVRIPGGILPANTAAGQRYDVTADGQKFVVATAPTEITPKPPVTVILNWHAQPQLQ